MNIKCSLTALVFLSSHVMATELTDNELSYDYYISSDKPIKCLYGYAAEKTGDHRAAIQIFEDCIRRWNSVYSMIWLAHIYETGINVKQDLRYATALLKRGAETDDAAGYSSLAKYHYGVALFEGKGVTQNQPEAIQWLKKSLDEGITEAGEYLKQIKH